MTQLVIIASKFNWLQKLMAKIFGTVLIEMSKKEQLKLAKSLIEKERQYV